MLKSIFTGALALLAMIGGLAITPAQAGDGYAHHVVFQVDDNDAARMNLTLNNAANVTRYYASKGQKVKIEIVAFGPGLNMLRDDTSPVKDRLVDFAPSFPDINFAACGNTLAAMTKKEGKAPPLIESDSIAVVPSGVVQVMMRQDEGWHYIRP
jgi:hypothetical protein